MPIYKSTLIKFLKSFSTWFPLFITLLIVSLIGAILPFLFLDLQGPSVIQTYKLYIVASVTTIGSATSIVSATFAAYKAVQIYKQEIEEGTFLVLVSKPINRKKIIFEKWLALFTIIALYVFILISFYIFLVLIIDPGGNIANLDIPPISDQIFLVGLILMVIILMLTLMFSSIALILSSKISSSATIALVAGLGAIIPITGLIPTFTNKQSQSMITVPINPLNANKIPRDETVSFIEEVIGSSSINEASILNLFKKVNTTYDLIDGNDEYVNNLGVNSGQTDIYSDLFFLDLNYQLSSIATIASDLLIPKKDSDFIAAAAMMGGFTQSPTLSGEVKVIKKNIPVSELSSMFLKTLQEYKAVTKSKEYGEGIYPFFDYILLANGITNTKKTTNENFLTQLITLIPTIIQNQDFILSPIISTILNDKNVPDDLKRKLENKNNPFLGEIKGIEVLLLVKINIELGSGLNLIISSKNINDFYVKNEIPQITDYKEALTYLTTLTNNNDDLSKIINEFVSIGIEGIPNTKSTIQLANIFLLTEESKNGINSFYFGDYANKWALFGIYTSITFILLPTSYFIIKKQDIR